MQSTGRKGRVAIAFLIAAVVPATTALEAVATSQAATVGASDTGIQSSSGVVAPDDPADLVASTVSESDAAVVAERHADIREQAALDAARDIKRGPGHGRHVAGEETQSADNSETLQLRRNFRNTRAQAVSSTLGETAAANEGSSVFYTGNTYASTSTNFGAAWAAANPASFPAGPSDAPFACCDQDVVRAHNRDRLFSIMLYVNGANPPTNGVVRIFVRNQPTSAPLCSYTIDPAGTANNSVPDYPHIALSANFLYLGLNNRTNTEMRRFNLGQMSACQTSATTVVSKSHTVAPGHRVWVPSEGFEGSTFMQWAQIETTTSLRIYNWLESSATATSVVRGGLHGSVYTNPDCRGGTGNFDFIERSTAWSPSGFRLRGARSGATTTFLWNVNRDGSHPQAHIHAAVFRTSDRVLLAQPHIFNTGFCFGFPAIDGNAFGEHGVSLAWGGRVGGGGSPAQGAVLVDDASSAGVSFPFFTTTATGTHNRADGRYGDYFTVRTKSQCSRSWVTNNYSLLNGNTSPSHVNARYIEMGSNADGACLNAN